MQELHAGELPYPSQRSCIRKESSWPKRTVLGQAKKTVSRQVQVAPKHQNCQSLPMDWRTCAQSMSNVDQADFFNKRSTEALTAGLDS